MKIKAKPVAGLKYIDVEVTAMATKISLGWHDKEQATELRDMLLSVVDDLSGFIEERPFGHVQPEAAIETPQGYVSMPTEPTEAMIDAGVAVAFAASVHGKGGWNNYMKALYRAFIAAAHEAKPEALVNCACGDSYPSQSYGAGFIHAIGHCPNCQAAAQEGK